MTLGALTLGSLTFPAAADLVGESLACRRGERLVFQGLDCRLPAGGALILSGPNGSGKSSLLRVLASLLTPAAGRLCWDGKPMGPENYAIPNAYCYRCKWGPNTTCKVECLDGVDRRPGVRVQEEKDVAACAASPRVAAAREPQVASGLDERRGG